MVTQELYRKLGDVTMPDNSTSNRKKKVIEEI